MAVVGGRGRVVHVATTDVTVRHLLLPQLVALRRQGWDVAAISAPGPWVSEIRSAGVRHIPWPGATRRWDPRADARAFVSLVRILRRERPDVVHTHNPKPGIIGRIAGRAARVPVVINTVHGFYATPEDPPGRRLPVVALEWLAARVSRLELYQSQEDLRWARGLGVAVPGRSRLLGNGVRLERFDPWVVRARRARVRAELGFGPDDVVVATVGRAVREKGFAELAAAAASVAARRPNVRFVWIGAPDDSKADAVRPEEVRAAAPALTVTGWRTDVPDLLGAVDVFVLASHREGLPRSAIEAAACGLPLVLTDIRGCREVAGDGAAILVPARDGAALTAAIERLVSDRSERERLGRAARARAIERFDERRVVDVVSAATACLVPRRRAGDVSIRPATSADAGAMAALHAATMPDAFLPTLGRRVLRRYEAALARDREAVAVVAEVGGRVVGFATGVPSTRRFSRRFLLRHGIAIALAAGPAALLRGAGARARESVAYGRHDTAELLAVAVDQSWRGRGLGRALGEAVRDALRASGCASVRVLVGATNDDAIALYRRLGFREHRSLEVHRGVASRVMVS